MILMIVIQFELIKNNLIINMSRTMLILVTMACLLVGTTSQSSLCLSCASYFGTYCITCNTGGCAAYSTKAASGQCECNPMYYLAQTATGYPYCDRCYVGCLTCAGPYANNCLSCANNFTYNSNTSSCTAPANANDNTLQQIYNFLGFGLVSNWGWQLTSSSFLQSSQTTYTCGSDTFVGRARNQYVQATYTGLQKHFSVRVMFAHYYFTSSSSAENIQIKLDTTTYSTPIGVNLAGSNNPASSCGESAIETMVDKNYTHTATSLTMQISTSNPNSNSVWWGIREVIVILRLCDSSCSGCTGYTNKQCSSCSETNRVANYAGYAGTCVCYGSGIYAQLMYQQTSANTCVYICPVLPVQTFGDNTTRNCIQNCPNNSYAYTDLYRCWADCPKTSIVSSQLLFKDKVYWRCVSRCPPQARYANEDDRTCYAICPNRTNTAGYPADYYAVDGLSPRCVSVCPYNSSFELFGYQGNCIPLCPDGTWGDPITKLCLADCTNTSSYPYKDNSSGQNICVNNCSYPDWFRDNTTFTCVKTCPGTRFGETNRECVAKCQDGLYGLPFGNRKCAAFCPMGWWGQPDADVCVNDPNQCNTTSNNRYGDNYTRKCVFPQSCSLGYVADNVSQLCLPSCPKAVSPDNITGASVADPNTNVCQSVCNGSLYADYVAGLCVSSCITNNTYADVGSGYRCVTSCNLSGTTPWRQNNTWTCVADCNDTGIASFLRDNTTWMCVFNCPPNYYADFVTSTNPICRLVCLTGTYADNSTGTGLCVYKCSAYPPKFGDATAGMNLCVDVCTVGLFGDQTGNRTCVDYCPTGYFAQNDTTRRCVKRCKPNTYGQNRWCNQNPFNCTADTFANDANNLCDGCSSVQATWGDPTTKRCVTRCPLNSGTGPITYYADITLRQCVLTCNSTFNTSNPTTYSFGLWGNNGTRTCEFVCSDLNAYVEDQSNNPYRVCVARCFPVPVFHYANNQTKVCGTSIKCGVNHFGENSTQTCVSRCPPGSFGYKTTLDKICIDICPLTWYGDNSTGVNLCVTLCPAIPQLYADPTTKLCVADCPSPYYADPTTRNCVLNCPIGSATKYYAYEPDRICVSVCPDNYFGNFALENITGLPLNSNISRCVTPSSACGSNQWGDPYLHKCVTLCTGPNPVSLYGHWPDCVPQCPPTYYANTYNGARICTQLCPPSVVGTAAPNLYGDPSTVTCVGACVTPLTWADYQTRLCEPICSATPIPTYSQNFNFTCVISLNCPTSPSMTFGDNQTRSCESNCTMGKFGDPTSRNCVTQCPNASTTGTSNYYSDISTGQYICVVICPVLPRLFGYNTTNNCVEECPAPLYGDQTGNRTCVGTCPKIGSVVHFAQNYTRVCVTVCISGTWGYTSTRECVEDPTDCNAQWADNTTNLCVNTCPATANTFGDSTTKFCVPLCPDTYFSDYSTRLCVQRCPTTVEEHGTFGNNETRVCEEKCSAINNGTVLTYADPQTINRYCVLQCSQNSSRSFADPSTSTCVPVCPTFPDLYGQTTNYTCVRKCTGATYADTAARLCVSSCPGSMFKLTSPNLCVSVCPHIGNVSLYGDPNTGFCNATCSNSYFRYDTLSLCVSSCQTYSMFAFNNTCVTYCPLGYYADSSGICVTPCPSTTYGQNSTTKCQGTCTTGYASGSLCVAVCPNGSYGQNFICVSTCQISGNVASNLTNTCVNNCTNGTYALGGQCVSNCTGSNYADPLTNRCSSSCTGGLYGDPTTKRCVSQCPSGYYKDSTMYCLSACVSPKYADNVTWSCTGTCSTGYWGHNLLCVTICPNGTYGYLSNRICYSVANRPVISPIYFADNVTQTWVTQCPFSPLAFGERTLMYCVPACEGTKYADPSTRQCEIACQNSSYFADLTTHSCVLVCPLGYFANSNNGKCQAACTSGYAYDLTHECVGTCPAPYSGFTNTSTLVKTCVLQCPLNYYSQSRVCSTSCVSSYADNTTNQCLPSCTLSFASDDADMCVTSCSSYANYKIADNSTNRCVSLCPSEPDMYEDNFVCVFYCSGGKYADPTVNVRKCTNLCTTGLFSDPTSGRCMAYCPLGYWAQNITNNCVILCDQGGFADNVTGKCVSQCPSPTYADPTTRTCVKTCPNNYYGEVNRTCMLKCTYPNYANPLNRRCQPQCPAFANLYAQNTTASCVTNCSIVSNSYADPSNNICVSNCTLPNFYMLDGQGICTNLCPEGLFMENSTEKCQSQCTTGFAEPTTRYCVARCFGNPQTFGHNKVCHYSCLNSTYNLYADNSTNLCVLPCPASQNYFSDPVTGNCVLWCQDGYFAQNGTRTCATGCTDGYADNLTRKCIAVCPADGQQTYGDPSSHKCVRVCPPNTYASNVSKECVAYNNCTAGTWSDPISKYCVNRCPSEPLSFGLDSTTSCVTRCPPGLFGDHETQTCVPSCPVGANGQYRFADPVSQTCVFVCPINSSLYGDTLIAGNFSCVLNCSGGQLRDNSTQRCVSVCPSSPSYWADLTSFDCVYHCPPGQFASNETDRLCVSGCISYDTYGDINARICTSVCPFGYWADNSSHLCKDRCPDNPDYYADNTTGTCVFNCSEGDDWVTFADPISRQCVTECPPGYFAQNSTQRCVTGCPLGQYQDPIIRVCVAECTVRPHWYKHTNRTCLYQCPQSPKAYKLDLNHSCVYVDASGYTGCPANYWANPLDNLCTKLCPEGYYADQTKHLCVTDCPTNQYADDVDRLCKSACSSEPEEFRLTLNVGTCVQFCPLNLFADNRTHDCKANCYGTPVMYAYKPTWQCVANCPAPYYSYLPLPSRDCRLTCPSPYYAQDPTRSCELTCISPYFADNTTNRCVLLCPFNDTISMYGHNNVCVQYCDLGYFADNSTRMCVRQCPTQPVTFAENDTRTCVVRCPSTPSSFADNTTMRCVEKCPNGTFAQVTSRSCVIHCPSTLLTYADTTTNACQPSCPDPYFASDLTKECVLKCPNTPVKTYAQTDGRRCVDKCLDGLFGQNISRTCTSGCPTDLTAFADVTSNLCVSTCPYGYYARNDTFRCSLTCPNGTYADNYTRRCLAACLGTLRLYSDASTMRCVSQCPINSYGNNQNWTCISNCPASVFGYKLDISNLCVQECPPPYFAFVLTRTCVLSCGAGLYGDSATRICNDCDPKCPTCLSLTSCLSCTSGLYLSFGACTSQCPPGTFANNRSMTCVYAVSCPVGQFGNTATKSCSSTCPNKEYPSINTRLCTACPATCAECTSDTVCTSCISTAVFSNITAKCYAYCDATLHLSYNGQCYSSCPDGTYLDFTNVYCQLCNSICKTCFNGATNCTSCDGSYLYNNSCLSNCPTNHYNLNNTCQFCNDSVPSCSKPLTFETVTKTQNYQSVIYLKFNQDVKVNGDPSQFITLNLNINRLLQSYSSMVNNGIPYTAQVMPDGTIKIILDPSISLTNPSFTVSINDPSKITTASGATLQSLEAVVKDIVVNAYPAGTTSDGPLVVAGSVLSIAILIVVAAIFLCSPVPIYHSIEVFQIVAFYAYITDLPPNFFYFLKNLSQTRFGFLPNPLAGLYTEPPGFVESIPSRSLEIDGQLSFGKNAGSYLFIVLIYGVISVILYLASRKFNPNRPLRELFEKLFNTRVKWSIVWDMMWLFGLNVMICGFMQFKYPANGGDMAVAVISLMIFISIPIVAFILRVKRYDPEDSVDVDNFKLINQGLKQGKSQYMPWIYFLRRLIFAAVIAGTVGGESRPQVIGLMIISILMVLTLLILRPYQQTLRNLMHMAHECGLIAFCVGCLYYRHYIEIKEPVGTKIICGTIMSGGMIAHLSIAVLWALYKSYHFYKELYKEFKKTEFYMLYLDEKYDENLQKQLQELNDQSGEVESVEVTNVATSDKNELNEEEEEGNQIIKLKIRRRRKIVKGGQPKDQEILPSKTKRRGDGDYIKVNNQNESLFELQKESPKKMIKEAEFEPVHIVHEEQIMIPEIDDVYEGQKDEWAELKNNSEVMSALPDNRLSEKISPREDLIGPDNIFAPIEDIEPGVFPIGEIEEISSVSNKEEGISKDEGEHLRESLSQMNPSQKPILEEQNYQLQNFEQDEEVISPKIVKVEPVEEPVLSENVSEKPEKAQEKEANDNEQQWQQMSKWQQLQSQSHQSEVLNVVDKPKEEKKMYEEEYASNFVINLDEQIQKEKERESVQEQKESEQKQREQKEKEQPKYPKSAWDMQIQDLLEEEQKKKNEVKKKHLLLFDPEDFQ